MFAGTWFDKGKTGHGFTGVCQPIMIHVNLNKCSTIYPANQEQYSPVKV